MDIITSIAGSLALLAEYMQYIFGDVVDRLAGEPTTEPLTGVGFMAQQIREMLIMASCGACVAFMFQAYNGCIKRSLDVSSGRDARHIADSAAEEYADHASCAGEAENAGKGAHRGLGRTLSAVLRRAAPLFVRGALVTLDIIFCIIAGVVIARFWFRSSYGRLSVHEAFGMIVGLAVGMRTFALGKSKRRHTIAVIYVILITTAYFLIS